MALPRLALSPENTTTCQWRCRRQNSSIAMFKAVTELNVLRGPQGTITALTFFADGTHLFSGEENGIIRRWDALTGQEVQNYRGSFSAITALVIFFKRTFSRSWR